MNGILGEIVEHTRAGLDSETIDWKNLHRAARLRSAQKPKFSFRNALRRGQGTRVIAEIKAASPSLGPILREADVEGIAAEYREGGAAAISVVTEPKFFGGERAWLHRASLASGLPILMKDFVIRPEQVYRGIAAGADAVLLIAAVLDSAGLREMISIVDELGRDAVVEVHDEVQLQMALSAGARIIGVNNRDLSDFSVDLGVSERLGATMPAGILRVSESGIRCRADVERLEAAGFDAFLVGESLLRSDDRGALLRRLRGVEE